MTFTLIGFVLTGERLFVLPLFTLDWSQEARPDPEVGFP